MAENNFSLQKTLTMLLDEKKYHSLRDILSTMNPADIAAILTTLIRHVCRSCSGFCPRNWPPKRSLKWSRRRRNCSFRASRIPN